MIIGLRVILEYYNLDILAQNLERIYITYTCII